MVSKRVRVASPQGMHMRPAQVFAGEMAGYDSSVTILFGGKAIDGKNIMKLMASCIKLGSEVELRCEGPQEEAALAAAVRLMESGLRGL